MHPCLILLSSETRFGVCIWFYPKLKICPISASQIYSGFLGKLRGNPPSPNPRYIWKLTGRFEDAPPSRCVCLFCTIIIYSIYTPLRGYFCNQLRPQFTCLHMPNISVALVKHWSNTDTFLSCLSKPLFIPAL